MKKRQEPLGLGLVVPFVPKLFWFGSFERSKPLGVWFALVVPFGAEGFDSCLLKKAGAPWS